MIAGRPCLKRLEDLPEPPDAVFIAIPAEPTIEAVELLAGTDAGGTVCFASGFRESRRRRDRAPGTAGRHRRFHADDGAELPRLRQLPGRRGPVARPAWRRARGTRRRPDHPERQHGDQSVHAATLAGTGLYGHTWQPGRDRHSRMHRGAGDRQARHRHRPAYRGPGRYRGFRARRRRRAGRRRSHGGAEDRPIDPGRGDRHVPHRLAGRPGRALRRLVRASGRGARPYHPGTSGGPETAVGRRAADGQSGLFDELFRRRGLADGGPGGRPCGGVPADGRRTIANGSPPP